MVIMTCKFCGAKIRDSGTMYDCGTLTGVINTRGDVCRMRTTRFADGTAYTITLDELNAFIQQEKEINDLI